MANDIKNYFKIIINKKNTDFDKEKGYSNASGYSSTIIKNDDVFDFIISHTVAPSNYRKHNHSYYLEIITKNKENFIYTTKEDKSIRLTQKKLKELKELILNKSDLLLKTPFNSTPYSSSFHNLSATTDFYADFNKYMSRILNIPITDDL